jgi:hypothetical protein
MYKESYNIHRRLSTKGFREASCQGKQQYGQASAWLERFGTISLGKLSLG